MGREISKGRSLAQYVDVKAEYAGVAVSAPLQRRRGAEQHARGKHDGTIEAQTSLVTSFRK